MIPLAAISVATTIPSPLQTRTPVKHRLHPTMTNPLLHLLTTTTILLTTLTPQSHAAFPHVIAGTGALEVQLIAAKLAIRAGDTISLVGPSDPSHIRSCRALRPLPHP